MNKTSFVPHWAQHPELLIDSLDQGLGARSVSDDDLCAWCASLLYCPGALSLCKLDWPGKADADGYMQSCEAVTLIQPG